MRVSPLEADSCAERTCGTFAIIDKGDRKVLAPVVIEIAHRVVGLIVSIFFPFRSEPFLVTAVAVCLRAGWRGADAGPAILRLLHRAPA